MGEKDILPALEDVFLTTPTTVTYCIFVFLYNIYYFEVR